MQPVSFDAIFQELLVVSVRQIWQRDQQHDHDVCAMPVKCHATQRVVQNCSCSASHAELAGYNVCQFMSCLIATVHATAGSLMGYVLCHHLYVGL